MRPRRVLLLTVLAISTLAFVMPTSSSADTIGDVGVTTDLIGILGGINLPQVNVPQDIDPEATQPADQGTTAPQETTPQQQPASHAASYYCRGESKRRPRGHRRSPFSQCVSAMSKLSSGSETSPAAACHGLSHKRPAGRRSPFAICVAGGKQLLADKG